MIRRPAIAVCGQSRIDDDALYELARGTGSAIARAGANLLCGGMGGVMEAACRGASEARAQGAGEGTLTVGIVPGSDRQEANPYCDVVVATGLGFARNVLIVLSADAVILVGGGSGTLSEAAFAWQLGKPVVALAPSGGWAKELAGRRLDDRRTDEIVVAHSPEEAVARALELMQA